MDAKRRKTDEDEIIVLGEKKQKEEDSSDLSSGNKDDESRHEENAEIPVIDGNKAKPRTASRGMVHAGSKSSKYGRDDSTSDFEEGDEKDDRSAGKRKIVGGSKREIKIEEDDFYGWWIMGLDMMEMGLSQQLAGIKLTKKAVKIMSEKHAKAETDSD